MTIWKRVFEHGLKSSINKVTTAILTLFIMNFSTTSLLADTDRLADLPIALIDTPQTTLGELSQGKPLYLKFWASWCVSCLKEMPQFQQDFVRYGRDIQFLSINVGIDDTKEDVKRIYQQYDLAMPSAIDKDGSLAQRLEFVGTPYHLVLSADWQALYKGHEANGSLQQALKLAGSNLKNSPAIASITAIPPEKLSFDIPEKAKVFYIAAWCDWYMEESDKALAKHCKDIAKRIVTLEKGLQSQPLVIVASPLWTDKKAITEYKERFGIKSAIHIDHNNAFAQKYQMRNFGVELDF